MSPQQGSASMVVGPEEQDSKAGAHSSPPGQQLRGAGITRFAQH